MTIYLIGPSGVGKTSCARNAAEALSVIHLELDSLCRGSEYDWPACSLEFAKLEYALHDQVQIVDLGAGTQTIPQLREYLSLRPERVVLLWAPEWEVIQRNPLGPDRTLDEFRSTEYASRRDLYDIAMHRIDLAGLSEAGANNRFVAFLAQTFMPPCLTSRAA